MSMADGMAPDGPLVGGAPAVGRLLGVDLGTTRIGIAVCDAGQRLATGLTVITRSGDPEADRRALARLADDVYAGLDEDGRVHARRLFLRLAVLVTLFLWLPDLYILYLGQPADAVAVLMVMHLAIAVVTYNLLVYLAPVRPSRAVSPAGSSASTFCAAAR